MAKQPKKGIAGNNTGSKVRSLIKEAQQLGMSLKEIASLLKRDESTVSDIAGNRIKNPPKDLIKKLEAAIRVRKQKQ